MATALASKGTAAQAGVASGTPGAVTPTLPASLASGDICVAQLLVGTISGQTMGRFTCPSDWEEIVQNGFRNSSAGIRGQMGWFWKRMSGGESGTVSFSTTFSSSNEVSLVGQIYRITGCPTTGIPWESFTANFAGDGNTTITWSATDVASTGRLLLAMGGQLDDSPGAATPTNYTNTVGTDTNTTNQDTQLFCMDRANTNTGASVTAANGETAGWATLHIAFHETAQAEFSGLAFRGNNANEVSGTTLVITPTIDIPTATLAVVVAAADNITTSSSETTDHAVTDSVGNTWTLLAENTRSSGVAADGVTVSLWITKTTVALTTSDTVTLTLDSAVTAKAASLWRALVAPGRTFTEVADAVATGSGTSATNIIGSLASATYWFVGGYGIEHGLGTQTVSVATVFVPGYRSDSYPDMLANSGTASTVGVKAMLVSQLAQGATGTNAAGTISTSSDFATVIAALQSTADGGGAPARRSLTLLGVS